MNTESSKLTVGYWPIRGLIQHILTLLEYTGTEYNFVKVTDRDSWSESKESLIKSGMDFPNLPYLQDGDIQMTETLAITLHIAKKYGDESLLFTPENMGRFFELYGVVNDIRGAYTSAGYSSTDKENLKAKMSQNSDCLKLKYQVLNNLLGKQNWLMGDNLTVVDFLWAEAVERINTMSEQLDMDLLGDYPHIKAYLERFINIPKIKAYRESEGYMTTPWNNTQAFWK